ncbi:hypothetical protein Micbo1qcDRAFT_60130 [Microdochium bolleyi]|uniref:Uncharacterized protein n=1 Tax=Microdochium bolleyi TaxID=196109 RepID=A0A136J4S1_9PEZI|nr:hypothetical protein Micbo1qcDRAFT_60130 [Microdochium bolleyi]
MDKKDMHPSGQPDAPRSAAASNGKGKDKDTTTWPPASTTNSARNDQNFGARVITSASKLASDLVTGPANASDIGKAVPASKGGSSRAAVGSSSSASVAARDLPSAGSSYSSSSHRFHSTDAQAHAAQQEAAFSSFLDGVPALEAPSGAVLPSLELLDYSSSQQSESADARHVTTFGSAGTRGEAAAPVQDGMDVVRLLESDAYDEVMAETAEDEPALSQEERASLRRALFGEVQRGTDASTSARSINWDDLLNFLPSYVSDKGVQGTPPAIASRQRAEHLGMSEAGDAQRVWAVQWTQVLASYTDEIWGDLSSLVHEARREVQEAEDVGGPSAAGPSEFPALRRLQQILGQVRGY